MIVKEFVNDLRTDTINIKGVLGSKMIKFPSMLSCSSFINTAPGRLAGNSLNSSVSPALRNMRWKFVRFFLTGTHFGQDSDDIGNNVAGFLQDHRIANSYI